MTEQQPDSTGFAVLYVDDEEMALKYFRRSLAGEMPVFTATSVDQALELLDREGERIGVLVTDQRMPGKTGVDLLHRVRRQHPDIVRLLTTAYADLQDAIAAVNSGEIFRYLTKPWDIQQLRGELRQAMAMFELRRERAQLVREKLSVWQRLVAVNRIRDLAVMAASFTHVRNAEAAVAAYLADRRPQAEAELAEPQRLDLWGLTEAEVAHSRVLIARVLAATGDGAGFGEPLELAQLLPSQASLAGADGLPAVRVDRPLAQRLLEHLSGDAAATAQAAGAELAGQAAIRLEFPAPALGEAEALSAYLIAWHHGGRLQAAPERPARLMLPVDPTQVPAIAPADQWLHEVLLDLEPDF